MYVFVHSVTGRRSSEGGHRWGGSGERHAVIASVAAPSTSARWWSSTAPTSSATPGRSAATTPTPRTWPRARWCARWPSARSCATPSGPSGTCSASSATSPPTRRAPAPAVSVEPWAERPRRDRGRISNPTRACSAPTTDALPRAAFADLPRGPPGGAAPPVRRGARLRGDRGAAAHHRARGAPTGVPRDAGAARVMRAVACNLRSGRDADGHAGSGEGQPARSARAPISTDGWRRRARARASIWRTRSRLRLTSWPTSSGVRGSPRSSPKRSVRM